MKTIIKLVMFIVNVTLLSILLTYSKEYPEWCALLSMFLGALYALGFVLVKMYYEEI